MRRFVAEALVDAASLVAIFFVLSLISVPQPFPFGAGRAPIIELTSGLGRGPGRCRDPGPRRAFRPPGDHRVHRAPAPVDVRPVHGRRERAHDLGRVARGARHRAGGPAAAAVVPRGRRPLHALHHAGERGARPAPPAGACLRGDPGDLAAARFAADAAPQPDPREPPPPADLRGRLLRHPRRGPRPDAGRAPATVVHPGRPRRARAGRRVGPDPLPRAAAAARADLREDRPDDRQPQRRAAAGGDRGTLQAPERRRALPVGRRAEGDPERARSLARGAVRHDRARAVRGCIDGAGPSRHAP